tara:strand:+ start:193982 stop:195004 length:1023 start_codon:yes stop_codon:yes gene_type:complete
MINMMNAEKNSITAIWQQELQAAFTNINELLHFLKLDADDLTPHQQAAKDFPLLVTRSYAERIKKSDWSDPLLRQVLPLPDELDEQPAYSSDPVGDNHASVLPGLIHKYHGRVLIVATGACAIHCRYCFRRSFSYANNSANRSQIDSIIGYINNNPDVTEVILSGGDPLTLSDARFRDLMTRISNISQIERIRIHTRLPIVLPNRITTTLLETLGAIRQKVIVVVHANHPNELTDQVSDALLALKRNDVTLLNQTVLLKGVNDNEKTLTQLSLRLFDCHTLPYYLHVLDKVSGAMHFDTDINEVYNIYEQLQRKLPGYLLPKLVREVQGKPYKTLLNLSF